MAREETLKSSHLMRLSGSRPTNTAEQKGQGTLDPLGGSPGERGWGCSRGHEASAHGCFCLTSVCSREQALCKP